MFWIRTLAKRLIVILRKRRFERDLESELRFHIEMETEQNLGRGMDPQEARQAASRSFGGIQQMKEEYRDSGGLPVVESLIQDLEYAVRSLWQRRGFTLVVILVLALGIGGTSSVFTLIESTLINDAPYQNAEQLVELVSIGDVDGIERRVSYPDFEDWREQAEAFEGLSAVGPVQIVFTDDDQGAEAIVGEYVSAGFFNLFQIEPQLGRLFLPEEVDVNGGIHPVVLLSERLWRRRFGADPDILGRTVTTTRAEFTVVGVLPAEFGGLMDMTCGLCNDVGFWLPASAADLIYPGWVRDRARRWHRVVGRLGPNARVQTAQTEMSAIARRLADTYADPNEDLGISVRPLAENWRGAVRPGLLVLMVGALFLLLIGCTNVANLLLARADGRRQEFAIRVALGAGRGRLVRQVLTESLLLSLAGGLLGALLTIWLADSIALASGATLPDFVQISVDRSVLITTAAVSMLAGVGFGLVPALLVSNRDPGEALKAGGRGSSGTLTGGLFGKSLIVAEVSLVLVLLIGATLMVQSFRELEMADVGFRTDNLLVMEINPNTARYQDEAGRRNFIDQLVGRLSSLPGAEAITIASPNLPPRTFTATDVVPEEGPLALAGDSLHVERHHVMPNFFEVLGIRLIEGRPFDITDRPDSPVSLVISESVARRLWPGESAIRKRVREAESEDAEDWAAVVGVVGDVKYSGIRSNRPAELDIYYSLSQTTATYFTVAARTAGEPTSMIEPIRSEVQAIDPLLPILVASTVEERFARQGVQTRFHAMILGGFTLVAFLLAAVGIYGVMAYSLRRRTREIGIRMVLGADRRHVLKQVTGGAMALVGLGLVVGLIGAWVLTGAMSSVLFGVRANDPVTFGGATLILGLVSWVATYLPARKAVGSDPVSILRED